MQLSDSLRERLAHEFRFAATKMRETSDPMRKLYFFSALYGEVSRVMNWEWDNDLPLIYSVLQTSYQTIHTRLQQLMSGDRIVNLTPAYFEALTDAAGALATHVEKNGDRKNLCEILGRIAMLAYVTTGNGYYLIEKGLVPQPTAPAAT